MKIYFSEGGGKDSFGVLLADTFGRGLTKRARVATPATTGFRFGSRDVLVNISGSFLTGGDSMATDAIV